MAQLAIPALIAGTALQGASSIMAGDEQSRSAQFEQQQLKAQEQQYKTAADQAEAQRRRDLTSSLETIQAIRAGRGVGEASPTGMAILDNTISDTERNIGIERANYLTRADQSRMASEMAGRKAQTSLLSGYLGAATGVASAGYKYGVLSSGKYPVSSRVGF